MARVATAGGMGKRPSKGTFIKGSGGSEKVALGGTIQKGGDLRSKPGKNQGSMRGSL